jgi:hypothetical protein
MNRRRQWTVLVYLFAFLAAILFCAGCGVRQNQADDDVSDDDVSADDDTGTVDDDATADDDAWDDDTTPDDDAGDDDAVPDDDAIDDDLADDDADDDAVDDDAADDDSADDDSADDDAAGVTIELIDGGRPGGHGASMALAPDGGLYIAAVKGRQLRLYSAATGESIIVPSVAFAAEPELAIDAAGHFHLAYRDAETNELKYTTNVSGAWKTETIASWVVENDFQSIQTDANGAAYIAYINWLDYGVVTLKYATNASGQWVSETVDTSSEYAYDVSLALDGDGHPHISYYRGNGLYYARKTAGYWLHTLVENGQSNNSGRMSSLAIDGDGAIHLAFYNDSSGELRYATSSAGLWWNIETVDADGGPYLSLAVDAAGRAYIGYYAFVEKDLKFASNAGGNWTIEQLDTPGDVGDRCSLVLDQAGEPHLSYYDASHGALKQAARSARGWEVKVVDAGGDIVQSRIAVDAENHTHLVYANRADNTVRYANNATGSWVVEIIDTGGIDFPYPDAQLAVDSAGHAHLALVRQLEGDLIYATNATGGWEFETVAAGVADAEGIALDGNGSVHISYLAAIDNYPQPPTIIMNYATNSSGSWVSETVDTWSPSTADETGFALDQDEQPRLAYLRSDVLIYASRDAAQWSFETVDDIGYNGVSLALDADGHAHIAYAEYLALRYATNQSGDWVIEELSPPYSTEEPIIALGDDGRISLVYYDLSNGDLRYATKFSGVWSDVIVDSPGEVGRYPSLALGHDGTARAAYTGEYALWYATFPVGYGGSR